MTKYVETKNEIFSEPKDVCDAILKTGDGCCFKVHREILSSNSAYFKALFKFGGLDRYNVEIYWFSGFIIKQILQYLYNGKIHLETDGIVELLFASDYFLLDDLLLKCQEFAREHFLLTNSVKIFLASSINDRLCLYKSSRRFICLNFSKLVDESTSDIADVPFELFKNLLEEDNLNIPDETYIRRAVEKWVDYRSERLPFTPELFYTIRFRHLDSHLVQCLLKSDTFKDNPYLKQIKETLSNTKLSDLGHVLASIDPKIDFTQLRQPRKLYLIANRNRDIFNKTDLFITYADDICLRRKITRQGSLGFMADQMVVVGSLACIGESSSIQRPIIFSLLDKSWNTKQSRMTGNYGYTLVQSEHSIYAVGGKLNCVRSSLNAAIESYDIENDLWKYVDSTKHGITVASMGNKIFILRKYRSNRMIAIQYDTISGKSTHIRGPKVPREKFGMIVYHNQLFVMGGINNYFTFNMEYLESVEVFNPESRKWSNFTSLPSGFKYLYARVVEDKLVVCDCDGLLVFLNEKEKSWHPFQSKCFEPHENFLICPIVDPDTITYLFKENLRYDQKWEFIEDDTFQ